MAVGTTPINDPIATQNAKKTSIAANMPTSSKELTCHGWTNIKPSRYEIPKVALKPIVRHEVTSDTIVMTAIRIALRPMIRMNEKSMF